MQYQGLTSDDLTNIRALNRLYLRSISALSEESSVTRRLRQLSDAEQSRLAGAPFLLFSFREQDSDYWERVLADGAQFDLLDSADRPDGHVLQLQVAGMSFLWQLVRRNPYAARIVAGAPVNWCERLASLTLVGLLQRVARSGDLLRSRFPVDDMLWRRLLESGTSDRSELRLAAYQCALQAMLASGQELRRNRAAAACTMRSPMRQDPKRHETGQANSKL